jgi:hypothetical protein
MKDAQRGGPHAYTLDGEGKIASVARGDMEQFREDWERNRSAAFACAAANQRTKDHGQRDFPIDEQMVNRESAAKGQPYRLNKQRCGYVEPECTSLYCFLDQELLQMSGGLL